MLSKMSDPAPEPAAPLDLVGWKIVLGVALPVALIAVGTAALFWYRHHQSSREKEKDLEDVGNMLEELRANQAEVAAMRESLQTGIERVKAMETEMTVRETNWSKHVFPICISIGKNDQGLEAAGLLPNHGYSMPLSRLAQDSKADTQTNRPEPYELRPLKEHDTPILALHCTVWPSSPFGHSPTGFVPTFCFGS